MFLNIVNPYYWGISLRNFFYDYHIFPTKKLFCPVISVGNLSCGGSGKTSLVRYLAECLSHKYRIGILLRGYKRKSKGYKIILREGEILSSLEEAGDEAYMLSYIFKGNKNIYVAVSEDRFLGGLRLKKEHHIDLLLLDDGFQHRKIARDLDLVLLKKKDLKDKLLPLGKLREGINSLKRADAIILTYQEVFPFDFTFKNKPIFKLFRKNWRIVKGNNEKLENWENKEFIAFCGLGDNHQFREILSQLQISVREFLFFPDHYNYKNFKISPRVNYLTTLKDFIKLPSLPNLYYLDFDIEVPSLNKFITSTLNLSL